MRPVLFCDFDGACLNTILHPVNYSQDRKTRWPCVDETIRERAEQFAEEINAEIVIISAWRRELSLDRIKQLVGPTLSARLHSNWKTGGGRDEHRGNEVLEWLEVNGMRPHIIFDDDRDFYTFQPLVRTRGQRGLTVNDIHLARFKLQRNIAHHNPVGGIGYLRGSLIEAPIKLIAHGCNAKGKMASGVAKAIRDAYPANYRTYKNAHEQVGLKLGAVVWHRQRQMIWQRDPWFFEPGRIIANVITQIDYGHDYGRVYVDYEAVRNGLEIVAKRARTGFKLREIGIPMIGAGLARGDWSRLEQIISETGRDQGVRFTVVIPDKVVYDHLTNLESNDVARYA